MLGRSQVARKTLTTPPNWTRIARRRRVLEERRSRDAETYIPPVEPTPAQACTLYRKLLKAGNDRLVCTDKNVYRMKLREEFEVTARRTSGRVRGIMFEKGLWLLKNDLGGLM